MMVHVVPSKTDSVSIGMRQIFIIPHKPAVEEEKLDEGTADREPNEQTMSNNIQTTAGVKLSYLERVRNEKLMTEQDK